MHGNQMIWGQTNWQSVNSWNGRFMDC